MEPEIADEDRCEAPEAYGYVTTSAPDRRLLCEPVGGNKREVKGLENGPVRATISVVAGKWKPLIIEVLRSEPLRFGVLLRRIPKASRKVLTDQLRDLQRAKIVSRTVLGKKSEHVEYSLSSYGHTLVPVLAVLARWGERHLKTLEDFHASSD